LTKKIIEFTVKLTYENIEGGDVCEESARDNLREAIDNIRSSGGLTPDDISAEDLEVSIEDVETQKMATHEEASLLLAKHLLTMDSAFVTSFVNDRTTLSAIYNGDSMWNVNKLDVHIDELQAMLVRELSSLEGKALVEHFEYVEYPLNITYEGDSLYWLACD
jgi:hypothetical protein